MTDRRTFAPLTGVAVADFSQNLAGPYAAQILGDLGADVIKVEPPGGDPARRWGPPFIGGQSHLFTVANRNKRSVVLDLKDDGDRVRALELAAVVAALAERRESGLGCRIEASLLDTALAWMSYHITSCAATGVAPKRMGSALAMIAPYEAFPTSDGSVMIAAGSDPAFRRLSDALELDLAGDPAYRANSNRVARRKRLAELVSERTRALSTEALLDLMRAHRVPAAPVLGVDEALRDAQTVATGMIRRAPHPSIEEYVDVAMPIRWDGCRAALRRSPPEVGEHQDEVFVRRM